MKTFLLTWNPKLWNWDNIDATIQQIKEDGFVEDSWLCRTKQIILGDRIFLLRQGLEPRGIVASGWAASSVFDAPHFDTNSTKNGQYVRVHFDVLLNPDADTIYPRHNLEQGAFANSKFMHWNSQASGIAIPDAVAAILENEWSSFIDKKNLIQGSGRPLNHYSPDEVSNSAAYYEGATRSIHVNVYERNPEARRICIRHYGPSYSVCGFNYEKVYGAIGIGFIHVHHLKMLSTVRKNYQIDPIKDLRPVCANCHTMIHSKKEPYSIEELKQMLRST